MRGTFYQTVQTASIRRERWSFGAIYSSPQTFMGSSAFASGRCGKAIPISKHHFSDVTCECLCTSVWESIYQSNHPDRISVPHQNRLPHFSYCLFSFPSFAVVSSHQLALLGHGESAWLEQCTGALKATRPPANLDSLACNSRTPLTHQIFSRNTRKARSFEPRVLWVARISTTSFNLSANASWGARRSNNAVPKAFHPNAICVAVPASSEVSPCVSCQELRRHRRAHCDHEAEG